MGVCGLVQRFRSVQHARMVGNEDAPGGWADVDAACQGAKPDFPKHCACRGDAGGKARACQHERAILARCHGRGQPSRGTDAQILIDGGPGAFRAFA